VENAVRDETASLYRRPIFKLRMSSDVVRLPYSHDLCFPPVADHADYRTFLRMTPISTASVR
jgi:hypothetical protein